MSKTAYEYHPWYTNVKPISETLVPFIFPPSLTADGGWLFRISDLAAPHHARAPCSPSFLLPKIPYCSDAVQPSVNIFQFQRV